MNLRTRRWEAVIRSSLDRVHARKMSQSSDFLEIGFSEAASEHDGNIVILVYIGGDIIDEIVVTA